MEYFDLYEHVVALLNNDAVDHEVVAKRVKLSERTLDRLAKRQSKDFKHKKLVSIARCIDKQLEGPP